MSKYARRTDANHGDIIDVLRALGCAVLDLSALGKGCPDILVAGGPVDECTLVEIKNPDTSYGRKGTTGKQKAVMNFWPKRTAVLWSVEDAIAWACGTPRPDPPAPRARKRTLGRRPATKTAL